MNVFNKKIIPLALVGYEMIKANSALRASLAIYHLIFNARSWNNNLLLTEREGRTGGYWPEVVTVRTEHREIRTKTTVGQYSPVRLKQARLVSSLLYGTHAIYLAFKCFLVG